MSLNSKMAYEDDLLISSHMPFLLSIFLSDLKSSPFGHDVPEEA